MERHLLRRVILTDSRQIVIRMGLLMGQRGVQIIVMLAHDLVSGTGMVQHRCQGKRPGESSLELRRIFGIIRGPGGGEIRQRRVVLGEDGGVLGVQGVDIGQWVGRDILGKTLVVVKMDVVLEMVFCR